MKFLRDLVDGEMGELCVSQFLETKGFKHISFNKDKFWDIKMSKDDKEYYFEVKTDRWEFYTRSEEHTSELQSH